MIVSNGCGIANIRRRDAHCKKGETIQTNNRNVVDDVRREHVGRPSLTAQILFDLYV